VLTADALDLAQIARPDFASDERQAVSRWRGKGFGAVLWIEPRSGGGWEQFIEAVLGAPGAWNELLFSCSSDWSYSEALYHDDLYLSGFVVTATIMENVVRFVTGVAPSESGRLISSQGDEMLVLAHDDNPGGYFIAGTAASTSPEMRWHAET